MWQWISPPPGPLTTTAIAHYYSDLPLRAYRPTVRFAFPGTRYALPGAIQPLHAPAQERPDTLDFEYKYHSLEEPRVGLLGTRRGTQGAGAEWVQLGCEPQLCASRLLRTRTRYQIRAFEPATASARQSLPTDCLVLYRRHHQLSDNSSAA